MRVVVKGVGFIGTNLVNKLSKVEEIEEIRVVLNKKTKNATNGKINYFSIDSFDKKSWIDVISEAKIIYDLSVIWKKDLISQIINNSFGPFLLASIIKPEQTLIWTSSSIVNNNIRNDYAFSKKIAETALINLNSSNIKIVKISDVYGPGQKISAEVLKPDFPARRIQRFVAAYKLLKLGDSKWIIKEKRHGFYRKGGKIHHEIIDDSVYPTYIGDVIDFLIKVPSLKNNFYEFYGRKLSNKKLVKKIQGHFRLKIPISLKKNKTTINKLQQKYKTTKFEKGLEKWLG